ncbi:hypothetical protein E2C01_102147 [Portunus trituberculatus]|uniref:Uncharacterized protein n=1 Tax=Portunus trituberculatus TaxID=210409 RepID=A0A5B7K7E2_PORTR|nr:hypothetical protein [Portunus trituberculatus]
MRQDPSLTHEDEMVVHEAPSNPLPSWVSTKRFCQNSLSSLFRDVGEDSGREVYCVLVALQTD